MQAQLLSSHSSLFRKTHYSYAALHECQQRVSVFLHALTDVFMYMCSTWYTQMASFERITRWLCSQGEIAKVNDNEELTGLMCN